MDWKNFDRSAHCVGQHCFHMVWTPKYRYPVFRFPNYVREMKSILRDVAKRHHIVMHELCVEADHVHCFIGIPHTMSVSKAEALLKGASAFEFRKRWRLRRYKALWSRGTFYRSIGSTTADAVHHYINDSHHHSKLPKGQQTLQGRTRDQESR